jgi:polysaccharide export outer membrane protein
MGDIIKVSYSGPDPAALAPFGTETTAGQSSTANNFSAYLSGYSVSDSGTVFLPILGTFKVADKPLNEVEALIQTKLDTYVRNAAVKIRLVSFKISVLGEVRLPGTYYIYNEMLTIPEALGYAGDMTDNADRTQIRLIRRKQGVVTINTIDMTSSDVLGSKNFYLQPNDVLYAVPINQKADRLNLPTLSVGISSITAMLVIYNILRK